LRFGEKHWWRTNHCDRTRGSIAELLTIKRRASEAEHGCAMPIIKRFLELHLERLAQVAAPARQENLSFAVLDRLLRDAVLWFKNLTEIITSIRPVKSSPTSNSRL
jgi:hypothetical protein